MTKLAASFYSAAVGHREIDGIYLATFAMPGEPPQWVNDEHGRPKHFTSALEAELAGFRAMAKKLNRARQEQAFQVKGARTIKTWKAPEKENEPTIEKVFGKKR